MLRGGVHTVHAEIAETQELEALAGLGKLETRLQFATGFNREGMGIDVLHEIHVGGIRIGNVKETVKETHFSFHAVGGVDPVNGAPDL